jgi:uncharacterized membrane protein YhaH (DUF805 family)
MMLVDTGQARSTQLLTLLSLCNAASLANRHFCGIGLYGSKAYRLDAMNAFAWFFLSLQGRVSRQEFWLGYIGVVVVALILARLLPHAGGEFYFIPSDTPDNEAWQDAPLSFGWPEFISLVLTWPIIAIYAKRLHDLSLSAWWLLLLPAFTFVVSMSMLSRLHVAAYCLLILVLGFLPGSHGPNRFGEDPLARPKDGTSAGDR